MAHGPICFSPGSYPVKPVYFHSPELFPTLDTPSWEIPVDLHSIILMCFKFPLCISVFLTGPEWRKEDLQRKLKGTAANYMYLLYNHGLTLISCKWHSPEDE